MVFHHCLIWLLYKTRLIFYLGPNVWQCFVIPFLSLNSESCDRDYALLKYLISNGFKCVMPLRWLGRLCSELHFNALYLQHIANSTIPYYRGSSTLATFVAVYALFGPTFPGVYDKERSVYMLFYPVCFLNASLYFSCVYYVVGFVWCILQGLSFAFPIPAQYADCCQDREGFS